MCTRFASLRSNAAQVRRSGSAPGLGFDLAEFAAWFAAQDRSCAYCRIPEKYIEFLDLRTQVGLPLQRLGVDRLDGARGYELSNITLCCFACNKSRSNTFSSTEMMELISEGISQAWTSRLAAKGIAWRRPSRPRRASAAGKKTPTTSSVRKGAPPHTTPRRAATAR